MCVENLDEKNETGKEKMKLIYFKNWHKWKESGNSAMPKRSHKVLNLSEKVFTCRKKKNIVYIGFGIAQGCRHPPGILERISHIQAVMGTTVYNNFEG